VKPENRPQQLVRIGRSLIPVTLSLAILLSSCSPGADRGFVTAHATFLEDVVQQEQAAHWPLRGDRAFDPSRLPARAQSWYDELWDSLRSEEQKRYIRGLARSDNLYQYARPVHMYITTLLTALRFTGDLALLDEVDVLTQLMRAELEDSWRGPARRDHEGRDGYLNWVWRNETSVTHRGKDIHETDEMGAHALIAEVAWAFHLNREFESPAGVDYGERADFWLEYLIEHFEAKWRERNGVPWPGFPFISRPHMHETVSFIKFNFYMYRLTGREPYLREARRLTDVVFRELREAETPQGAAFVWRRSIVGQGGGEEYLMPTTYGGLVLSDALDLHLEGLYGWADPGMPTRFANTLSAFIINNGSENFARDVGGGVSRSGFRPSNPFEWSRQSSTQFAIKPFALLAHWDESGRVEAVSAALHHSLAPPHNYPFLATGLLIDAILDSGEGGTTGAMK
jgi:hypothetical protein